MLPFSPEMLSFVIVMHLYTSKYATLSHILRYLARYIFFGRAFMKNLSIAVISYGKHFKIILKELERLKPSSRTVHNFRSIETKWDQVNFQSLLQVFRKKEEHCFPKLHCVKCVQYGVFSGPYFVVCRS